MSKGIVLKGITSKFDVSVDGVLYNCTARGKLKKEGEIRAGDYVEVSNEKNDTVIERVYPRKNALIRPYVANVDICFIVIAPVPQPDFILVEKIIINAIDNHITPVLVINKNDISDTNFYNEVINDYKNVVDVIAVSAKTGENIDKILDYSKNKTVCLAGQSAVGKSSILNAILGGDYLKTGGLSKKLERGKHTTRQSEIFKIGDSFIIDTCGFSMLEFPIEFKPDDLKYYYPEFQKYADNCKFRNGCTHTNEPDCSVKKALSEGKISKNRYERYCKIYNELSDRWRKRYD